MKIKLVLLAIALVFAGLTMGQKPPCNYIVLGADSRIYTVSSYSCCTGQYGYLTSGKWKGHQEKYTYTGWCAKGHWTLSGKWVCDSKQPSIKRPSHCRVENGCWKQVFFPIP